MHLHQKIVPTEVQKVTKKSAMFPILLFMLHHFCQKKLVVILNLDHSHMKDVGYRNSYIYIFVFTLVVILNHITLM
jgi:hypothetical protein